MRKIIGSIFLILIGSAFLIQDKDFQKYLSGINDIDLPIMYSSWESIDLPKSNFDQKLFEKYKHIWSSYPIGKFNINDSIKCVLYFIAGDGPTYVLMTYNGFGIKIDSLNPYKNSGKGMAREGSDHITINQNSTISVIDSVYQWELTEDGSKRIPESKKLSIGYTEYLLSNNGKIIVMD